MAPELVSLEVASQTPSIIKRGFEYMYHKSHGYRLTGGSLYFGSVPNLVRKSQRDVPPCDPVPIYLDSDAVPPPHTASISPNQREKHDRAIAINIRGDSAKKVTQPARLISLEEAQRREVSRRNRAADRALQKEARIEREVSLLKHDAAQIARKRAQAKREEEENISRLAKEGQQKKMLEVSEQLKQERGPTLTAAVAAREGGLVVVPTNWIVPLISLDEARHTEKVKRHATDTKLQPSLPPSAVASVNSLTVNAGNGDTTTLKLISLEEARERDQARRLEKEARSRTRMLARAGTGLSHVSLITLVEARKKDAIGRRNGSSQDQDKPKPSDSTFKSRKPSHSPSSSPVNRVIETGDKDRHASPEDASAPQEKARWLALMSGTGDSCARPNPTSGYSYRPYTNAYL
jgi:hypothetical protein